MLPADLADAATSPKCHLCDRPNCSGSTSHHPNSAYLGCRQCGLDLYDLRSLFFKPAERSPSTCEICGYRYRQAAYAGLHFLSHFSELSTASRPLLCVQCRDVAETESSAETTNAEEGTNEGDVDDGDADGQLDTLKVEMLDYECELCGLASELYSDLDALNRHKADDHLNHEMIIEADDAPGDSDAADAIDEHHLMDTTHDDDTDCDTVAVVPLRRFACTKCDQHFESRNKLTYHRSKVHTIPAQSASTAHITSTATETFACRLCEAPDDADDPPPFGSRNELRAHEDAVHRDAATGRFACTHCDRDYTCVSFLALHLLKHTNRKRFACDVCGKAFGRRSHMQYHRSLHTTEHAFECGQCERTFKTAVSLRRHRVHMHPSGPTEVRRYPCELCDKVFKDTSDRRRHRYSHGGFERRHACDLCDARFHELKGLRVHRQTHERKAKTAAVPKVDDSCLMEK